MNLKPHALLLESVDPDAPTVPAAGGGAPSPAPSTAGSDVDWAEESRPDHEPTKATPQEPKPAASAAPAEPAVPATPAEPVAPAAPAAAAPSPATPAPTTPVPPAQPAAAAPVAPAPAAPAEPVPAAPAAAPDLAALRTAEVQRLTSSVYGLTEEQSRGLLVEPEKHLPAMLANMHVNIVDAVVGSIYARLPETVRALTQQGTAVQEAQNEFYRVWPQLREKPEYEPKVEEAIRAYRQLNPKAPREEVIRAAGLTAMISLRLPLPKELFDAPPTPPQPAPGFVPVAPAAGGGVPQAKPQPGAFELLNQEFDREEHG